MPSTLLVTFTHISHLNLTQLLSGFHRGGPRTLRLEWMTRVRGLRVSSPEVRSSTLTTLDVSISGQLSSSRCLRVCLGPQQDNHPSNE